jgi:hypothetical protein
MFGHLNSVLKEVQRLSCARSGCEDDVYARGAIHILNLRYAQVRRKYEEIEQLIKTYKEWIRMNEPLLKESMRWLERKDLETNIAQARINIETLTQQRNELWVATDIEAEVNAEIANDTTIQKDTPRAAGDGPSYSETTPPQTPTKNSAAGGEEKTRPAGKPSGVMRNSQDSSQMRELLSNESNDTIQPLNARNVVKRQLNSSTSSTSSDKSTETSRVTSDTTSSLNKKRSKIGGTTKNKRRTQKRVASRRRKRNKRSTTRRKRYTRKQKK